jgi:hypothetical protein
MPLVVLLSVQDTLGAAFGVLVILWSVWLVYYWAIKPEREARRRRADLLMEQMHEQHWKQLKTLGKRRANPSS